METKDKFSRDPAKCLVEPDLSFYKWNAAVQRGCEGASSEAYPLIVNTEGDHQDHISRYRLSVATSAALVLRVALQLIVKSRAPLNERTDLA